MDFKFNFGGGGGGGEEAPEAKPSAATDAPPVTPTRTLRFTPTDIDSRFRQERLSLPSTAPSLTRCIVVKPAETSLDRVIAFTDVLPGVYEGGFKVWECSLDLVAYLAEAETAKAVSGGSVLELGCGHGLPGVMCLKLGATSVHLQDLNEDVLQHVTMPTVQVNVGAEAAASSCTYVSGDWASLSPVLTASHPTFNVMLSSEGIYNPATYPVLCALMNRHLAPDGFVLFAAKRFYFGVGGGTPAFEAVVKERCPDLRWEVVRVFEDGGSNIREIVKISRVSA